MGMGQHCLKNLANIAFSGQKGTFINNWSYRTVAVTRPHLGAVRALDSA